MFLTDILVQFFHYIFSDIKNYNISGDLTKKHEIQLKDIFNINIKQGTIYQYICDTQKRQRGKILEHLDPII